MRRIESAGHIQCTGVGVDGQRIVFVTGKGGVGKSAVAAAYARQQARTGQRVLLAELGKWSFFSKYLQTPVEYRPQEGPLGFDLARWDYSSAIHEYVLHYFKVEAIYKLIFENPLARTFLNIAPAAAELAILGKITSGIRRIGPKLDYDVIVVDAYASGHFMSLIRAPRGIIEATRVGAITKESRSMLDVLTSPMQSEFLIVSLPEELPIVETAELYQGVQSELGRSSKIVLNKCLPDLGEISDRNSFASYYRSRRERIEDAKGRLGKFSDIIELPFSDKIAGRDIVKELSSFLVPDRAPGAPV